MIKLGAKDLRTTKADPQVLKKLKKNSIYIILDNVLDTYNIGAIFRLADAVAATEIIICGESEIPPHTRIKKASINTTEWVKWEYKETALDAIKYVKQLNPNTQVISIELDKRSVPYNKAQYNFPLALIIGHESNGVSKDALEASDLIVELPMFGVNKSLNVMVSLGIVLYEVVQRLPQE